MLVFLNETGIRRIGSSTSFKYSDIVYTISGSQRYKKTAMISVLAILTVLSVTWFK